MQHAVPAASEAQGVNIPGHFFLTPAAEGTEFLVDAFESERLGAALGTVWAAAGRLGAGQGGRGGLQQG